MGLPEVGGSSAQADPRPHCPPRRPGGVRIADGPGGGESGIPTSAERAWPALPGEPNRTPPEASLHPKENGFQVSMERVRKQAWENVNCAVEYRIHDVTILVTWMYLLEGLGFGF